MNHQLDKALIDLRPEDAIHQGEIFPRERRMEILTAIVDPAARLRHSATPRRRSPRGRAPKRATGLSWARRPVMLPTLGAVVALAVAVVALAVRSGVAPQPAVGAVAFKSTDGGDIIATVTNPFAAANELKSAFVRRGFHITLTLIPVSPSLVGTVVYTSDNGGSSAIQPLQRGHCISGGGGCAIGVNIPASFAGHGYITLGRPARAGENYDSQASAFAPGEQLHCSGLLGSTVAAAQPALAKANLSVEWREAITETSPDGAQSSHSQTDAHPPSANHIWDADMTAPGKVAIWTDAAAWPDDNVHGAQFNRGC